MAFEIGVPLRVFLNPNGESMWVYGPGTRHPGGDYYFKGHYRESADPSLTECVRRLTRPYLYRELSEGEYAPLLGITSRVDDGL